jgi:hypothetical protein
MLTGCLNIGVNELKDEAKVVREKRGGGNFVPLPLWFVVNNDVSCLFVVGGRMWFKTKSFLIP